jgi:Phosphotransferase enzyme family
MSRRTEKRAVLTAFQEDLLLAACPSGSRVVKSEYFCTECVPGPVRCVARLPDGSQRTLVLRLARHGSVEEEACLLPILARMGIPVPEVLTGPQRDPGGSDAAVAVYSYLGGMNLQELSESSDEGCEVPAGLVVEGANKLADLTDRLKPDPRAQFLPTITLLDQLAMLDRAAGPWIHEKAFADAVHTLRPVLNGISDPPVFTGGDYQPANFLTDGKMLTGFVDFENSRYQDFLFGFAKYPIYDIHPLNTAGFVPFLLDRTGVEPEQFDIRLALGCLATLQREIPVTGGDNKYREHVLHLLADALSTIR